VFQLEILTNTFKNRKKRKQYYTKLFTKTCK